MPIPFLDLRAQYARIKDEVDAAVAEVMASQQFVGGSKVVAFEEAMAAFTGASYAVALASGTDALLLLLKAAGIGPGDGVITTPFTFFATAGAIWNAGATPVFVDVEPDTFNLDATRTEAAIAENTRAILPVHLFGQCADMDPIMAMARKHSLTVIEDAAQAIGARYHGRLACTLGDAGALSFFPSKNLGGFGDGGMALTSDANVARKLRLLRNHGAEEGYYHTVVGTNSRLDALQAAVLLVKLAHLDEWTQERRAHAAYYNEQFREMPEITTPAEKEGRFHVYNQFVIRLPRRDDAKRLFQERGIGCNVYYPRPLHVQECFRALGYDEEDFPVAAAASREVLALPVYPDLTREQQDEVVRTIKDHLST